MSNLVAYSEDQTTRVEIEKDAAVGYYVYAYSHDSTKSFADHLCDTYQEAIACAKKRYGVSSTAWPREAETSAEHG